MSNYLDPDQARLFVRPVFKSYQLTTLAGKGKNCLQEYETRPQDSQPFLCSTQLSMKFILLTNVNPAHKYLKKQQQ